MAPADGSPRGLFRGGEGVCGFAVHGCLKAKWLCRAGTSRRPYGVDGGFRVGPVHKGPASLRGYGSKLALRRR